MGQSMVQSMVKEDLEDLHLNGIKNYQGGGL
jgi:hypothetical protein